MSDAVTLGLITAVPTTVLAAAALVTAIRVERKAAVIVAKADVIVAKTEEIRNYTNGAYKALEGKLAEAVTEIAALKALWEPKV